MDPIANQTVPTEAQARRVAELMGCEGAHEWEGGWAPCESREALMTLIRDGAAGYRAWKHRQGRKSESGMAVRRYAPGRHPVLRRYRVEVANNKPIEMKPDGWEDLGGRGVTNIDGSNPGVTVSRTGSFGG